MPTDTLPNPEKSPERSSGELIRLEQVTKRFGDNTVLDHLDFSVDAGKHVTLIGPSGSGKTTILRLLMTLLKPDEGTITVDGQKLFPATEKERREVRKQIGMVFQQFNLFPNMSVLRNITEAPVTVLGMPKDEAVERAKGLLDEVTSALDPELVAGVLDLLRDIARSTDITMLCVTHEMNFARDISDQVLMFDSGRVIEAGAPEKIFSEPEHDRTREFLSAVL